MNSASSWYLCGKQGLRKSFQGVPRDAKPRCGLGEGLRVVAKRDMAAGTASASEMGFDDAGIVQQVGSRVDQYDMPRPHDLGAQRQVAGPQVLEDQHVDQQSRRTAHPHRRQHAELQRHLEKGDNEEGGRAAAPSDDKLLPAGVQRELAVPDDVDSLSVLGARDQARDRAIGYPGKTATVQVRRVTPGG